MRRKITAAERRQRDAMRVASLRRTSVWEKRLERDRRKELKRVLEIAEDYQPDALADVIRENIDESGYLPGWWQGLWSDVGLPYAEDVAKRLREEKAVPETDVWLSMLRRYATTRAGNEIVIVSGTWKDGLVKIVRGVMESDLGQGIEKITKRVYEGYLATLDRKSVV